MAPRPSVSAASSPSVRAVASSSSSLSSTASTSSKTSAPHQAASHADRFVLQGRLTPNAAERVLTRFLGLRYHEDLRTLMFCGLYFSLVALQLKVDFPWRAERIALFWLTGFLSFLGAVTVHNAVHCPIFKQNWKNQMFQVVLSVWFGHCASSYVPGHNLSHHRNLQTPKDVMRTTKMKFRWNFLNGLLFMPTILMATGANDANYFNAQAALKRPIYYQLRFEALVYVAFQVLVAAASPQKWLFVCWLPCLVGKYGIVSLNMLQHDGCTYSRLLLFGRNPKTDTQNGIGNECRRRDAQVQPQPQLRWPGPQLLLLQQRLPRHPPLVRWFLLSNLGKYGRSQL